MQINDLMKRIADGDERAFQELYDLSKRKVKAIAFNILHSNALAEEAVQETFIRIWKFSKSYKYQYDDERWICKIATNVAKSIWTKEKKTSGSFGIDNISDADVFDDASEIFKILDQEELVVLKMRIMGFKQKEIAKRLGIKRDKVNYLCRTTKNKILDYLKE